MKKSLDEYMKFYKDLIDRKMEEHIDKLMIPDPLKQSMLYSIQAGGKRLRPVLLIASNQAYEHDLEKTISPAIALEMIHTYSLIHDDLPAMDDDDFRRGKLTNHKVFGEATAILAGDALLTYSFEMIANDSHLTDVEKVKLIKMLSRKSGALGMVGGQVLDLEAENKLITIDQMKEIHQLKTGKLLKFAILAGAFLGKATEEELFYLDDFAKYLGLIFQIQDDILDVIGDEEKVGKPIGSDEDNQKSTYPKLLGLDGARNMKNEYVEKAKQSLIKANANHTRLLELTDFLMHRDH